MATSAFTSPVSKAKAVVKYWSNTGQTHLNFPAVAVATSAFTSPASKKQRRWSNTGQMLVKYWSSAGQTHLNFPAVAVVTSAYTSPAGPGARATSPRLGSEAPPGARESKRTWPGRDWSNILVKCAGQSAVKRGSNAGRRTGRDRAARGRSAARESKRTRAG